MHETHRQVELIQLPAIPGSDFYKAYRLVFGQRDSLHLETRPNGQLNLIGAAKNISFDVFLQGVNRLVASAGITSGETTFQLVHPISQSHASIETIEADILFPLTRQEHVAGSQSGTEVLMADIGTDAGAFYYGPQLPVGNFRDKQIGLTVNIDSPLAVAGIDWVAAACVRQALPASFRASSYILDLARQD